MTFDGRMEALITVPSGVSISATNAGGTATVSLPQNTYFLTSLLSTLQTQLNNTAPLSNTWTVTLSTGTAGTGQVTINGGGTWSLTWSSSGSTLQTLLGWDGTGNVVNSAVAVTGSKQARGLWRPDCPIWMESEPKRTPKVSDLRTTISPTGVVKGLVGNFFYRHTKVTWELVPLAQIWESSTSFANSSWEFFYNGTQFGNDSTGWFSPVSAVQIYDHNGSKLGLDANGGTGLTTGWQIVGVGSVEPTRYDKGAPIAWTILLPQIVSSG